MLGESQANGPEGRTVWDFVAWRRAGRIVANLRQRIFRAARAFWVRAVNDLLEPCAGKLARTVLRGGGGGDTLALPGERREGRRVGRRVAQGERARWWPGDSPGVGADQPCPITVPLLCGPAVRRSWSEIPARPAPSAQRQMPHVVVVKDGTQPRGPFGEVRQEEACDERSAPQDVTSSGARHQGGQSAARGRASADQQTSRDSPRFIIPQTSNPVK
jgi:hypothetical protein